MIKGEVVDFPKMNKYLQTPNKHTTNHIPKSFRQCQYQGHTKIYRKQRD